MLVILIKKIRNLILSIQFNHPETYKIPSYLEGIGIVDKAIDSSCKGRVSLNGTWWPAKGKRDIDIEEGKEVYVVALDNITLIVELA